MYHPTKHVVRGSNVDCEERMELLANYKDWLKEKNKDNKKQRDAVKEEMKRILREGIRIATEEDDTDYTCASFVLNDSIIYHMTGCMVRKMRFASAKHNHHCVKCVASVDVDSKILPENFTAQYLTSLKNNGGLAFASTNMFKLIRQVELVIQRALEEDEFFVQNAFENVLYWITEKELPPN